MCKVDILLATYNGAQYLREQMDSIVEQSYHNWQLYIRDDNSSDNTLEIIAEYTDSRIKLVTDDVKCGSAQANFMQLLTYSTSNFVCFCDQDDIWIKNKLQSMFDFIATKDNTQAQVIFSDGYLYYSQKKNNKTLLLHARPRNLQEQLFCNGGMYGSTSMFNAKMRELMLKPIGFLAMHDHLLTLLGCAFNGINYLEQPTFYYRQHLNNVTPHVAPSFAKRITNAFTQNRKLPVVDAAHYKGVAAFFKTHKQQLSPKNRKLCQIYLSYPQKNRCLRLMSILKLGFSINNSKANLIVKMVTKKYSNLYK